MDQTSSLEDSVTDDWLPLLHLGSFISWTIRKIQVSFWDLGTQWHGYNSLMSRDTKTVKWSVDACYPNRYPSEHCWPSDMETQWQRVLVKTRLLNLELLMNFQSSLHTYGAQGHVRSPWSVACDMRTSQSSGPAKKKKRKDHLLKSWLWIMEVYYSQSKVELDETARNNCFHTLMLEFLLHVAIIRSHERKRERNELESRSNWFWHPSAQLDFWPHLLRSLPHLSCQRSAGPSERSRAHVTVFKRARAKTLLIGPEWDTDVSKWSNLWKNNSKEWLLSSLSLARWQAYWWFLRISEVLLLTACRTSAPERLKC